MHVDDRRLPNGAKVDFGHGSQTRKTKPKPAVPPDKAKSAKPKGNKSRAKSPLLPNGDKPDYSSFHGKPAVNGDKPLANGNSNGNGNKSKKKPQVPQSTPMVSGDSYAGSSFHLSPEAVALPKPTFKTKLPPPSNLLTAYPAGLAPAASPMYPQQAPFMMNQQVPGQPQPQQVPGPGQPQPMLGHPHQRLPQGQPMPHPPHPIPANVHPGFTYQVNPQGYIVYPPQPGAGPVPGYGGPITTHFQQPMPLVHPTQQQQGQRITFADLMSSQK